MILFLEDWEKKHPYAIVDTSTKNESWLRLAKIYQHMGVKNHAFMLALHNPGLQGIDPFDPSLTQEQILAIIVECKDNPWYFFREILKLSAQGSEAVMVKANRFNIALWWLFFNHVQTFSILQRQIGKSVTLFGLITYILDIAAVNTNIHLLTKDDDLRVKSVTDVKDMMDELPWYMKLKNRSDAYNTEKITINELGNTLNTSVAQASAKAANNIGRGMTVAIHLIDEFNFIKNIEITLPALLASASASVESARRAGSFYGNIFTSTAGYLSSPEGRFGYKLYKECLRWDEHLYDAQNEENLYTLIKRNSPSGRAQILLEFNHRQLGHTDEWLRDKIERAMATGVKAEAEFLNKWAEGNESSPIPKEYLERISKSIVPDPITQITKHGYIVRWYVPQVEVDNKLRHRKLIMGMDTSDAIGNDDIAMVIRDATTGEIVGAGLYNETNLVSFANWLAEFLVEYENITLIIERRSSGVVIIDNLLLLLPTNGIDPFKRIFNWVTNGYDLNQEYKAIVDGLIGSKHGLINKYRKEFGYATSGMGRASRDNLYGLAFNAMVKYTCDTMRDKDLIHQISSLVRRNDRIDHQEGEKDDIVVASLLTYYFLTQAKCLHKYGLSPRTILTTVTDAIIKEEGGLKQIEHRRQQAALLAQIDQLVMELKQEYVSYKSDIILAKIKRLYRELDVDTSKKFNMESLMEEINRGHANNSIKLNFSYI